MVNIACDMIACMHDTVEPRSISGHHLNEKAGFIMCTCLSRLPFPTNPLA